MGNTTPYVVSFLLRFIYGVMQILLKVAFNQGTSVYVLVFYRHVIAIVVLLPIAFAIERYAYCWIVICLDLDVIWVACAEVYFCRKTAPQLSYKVSLKLFVHALYGQVKVPGRSFVLYFNLLYQMALQMKHFKCNDADFSHYSVYCYGSMHVRNGDIQSLKHLVPSFIILLVLILT